MLYNFVELANTMKYGGGVLYNFVELANTMKYGGGGAI